VTAAALFEAALALMKRTEGDTEERGWLLLHSSRLLRYVDIAKARGFAEEAVVLAQAVHAGALAAYARFQYGLLDCLEGDAVRGLPELEASAAAITALTEAEREAYAAHAGAIGAAAGAAWDGTVVMWLANVGRYREARERGEHLVAEAEQENVERLQWPHDLFLGLGHADAALGMPNEAAAMLATAHANYLRVGHYVGASIASVRMVVNVALPYRAEEIAERRALVDRAEQEADRASGAVSTGDSPRFFRLPLLLLEGEWEAAEQVAAAVSAEGRGTVRFRSDARGYLALLSRLRGNPERAWSAVRGYLPLGSRTAPGTVADFVVAVTMQQVAAALALDTGDLATAKEWLHARDYWLAWSGAVLWQSEGQALWAQYHRQAGDTEQAWEHARRALAHATEPRQPLALLAAHRLLGEIDTVAGRHEDAALHLDAALALADACAAPYERALTLLALAELRSRPGDGRRLATSWMRRGPSACPSAPSPPSPVPMPSPAEPPRPVPPRQPSPPASPPARWRSCGSSRGD
jgi:hypothetical protein